MRSLSVLAIHLAALALASTAHATPTVLFDLEDVPATVTPGPTTHTLRIRYSVSGNSLQNARIDLDLPAGLIPVGAGKDPGFTGGCTFDDPSELELAYATQDWRCSFVANNLAVPQGGLSGQIALTVIYRRWGLAHNETVTVSPSFSATWDDAGVPTPVGPFTATATTLVTGTVSPELRFRQWSAADGAYGYVTLSTPSGPVTGLLTELLVEASNEGSIAVDPGYHLDLALPEGVVYAGLRRGNGAFDLAAPGAVGSTGALRFVSRQSLGQALAYPYADPASGESYGFGYSESGLQWFYVLLVVPCANLPVPSSQSIAATLTGTAPGLVATPTQLASRLYGPGWGINGSPDHFLCGRPTRSETRSTGSGAEISQAIQVVSYLHGPTGAVPVIDAFTSAHYPDPVTLTAVTARIPMEAGVVPGDAGLQVWACTLPLYAGPITRAEFFAAPPGACTLLDGDTYSPTPPDTSHLVALSPVGIPWVVPTELGPTVAMPLELRGWGFVDRCMEGATEETFVVATYGEASDGLSVTSATSSHTFVAPVTHVPGWSNYSNPATATRSQRQTLTFGLSGRGAPLKNPTISMPVPPGVLVLDVRPLSYGQEGCVPPPLTWQVGAGVLTLDTGTAAAPWYFDVSCDINGCNQGGPLNFEVDLLFLPTHPFVNGQRVAFAPTVTGDNTRPGSPSSATFTHEVVMQVPGEKRLVLEPACLSEGELTRTGVKTRFENSGGIPLSDLVVEVPLPRIGDGSGTQVDTRLATATSTHGTLTCSSDGTNFGSTCGTDTRVVRVSIPSLAPFESGELLLLFADEPSAPTGAVVRHRASMSSDLLLPIAAPPGPPARWGLCPGTLVIEAWFDDGYSPTVRDETELGLAGWTIVLTDQSDPTIRFELVVPASGIIEVDVGPGTYDVTVIADSQSPEAQWAFNPAAPTVITIGSGETTSFDLGATCACDDGEFCTLDRCELGGLCVYAPYEVDQCIVECGDGRLSEGEECDSPLGVDVAAGCIYCSCSPFGFRVDPGTGRCVPVCGDGHRFGDEECDDGNLESGDGCDASCRIEAGFGCSRPEASTCPPETVCGEPRASWCEYADPENPGAAPGDWCPLLADGLFDGLAICESTVDCEALDRDCLDPADPPESEEAFYACLLGVVTCDLCDAFGPSTCGLDTVLTSSPTAVPQDLFATFTYTNPADPTHTSFDCRIDGGEWFACDGGEVSLGELALGEHTFEVRTCTSTRSACDPSPASATFTVEPSEPSPDEGPEPQPETGPEPQPEEGPEPQPETGPEPQPEEGPEPQPEEGPEPQPEEGPEPQPEEGPEAGPEPQAEAPSDDLDGVFSSGSGGCAAGGGLGLAPALLALLALLQRRSRR